MIGGMSIPCERENYGALVEEGVGLIVNLTEAAVTPGSILNCETCGYEGKDVYCEDDIFEDVLQKDELECLLLPMKDGFVPSFKQVDIFLKCTKETMEKGKKVLVHCHAGVGRTGTFLAIYLMIKYGIGPDEALKRLRFERPQSLQFNPDDWVTDPYLIRNPEAYKRNLLQERYLHLYYEQVILKGALTTTTSSSFSSIAETVFDIKDGVNSRKVSSIGSVSEIDTEAPLSSLEFSQPPTLLEAVAESTYIFTPEFTEEQVDEELHTILGQMSISTSKEVESPKEMAELCCHYCRNVCSVGPSKIQRGMLWPPVDAPCVYN